MRQPTGFSIINLRDGDEVTLLFPEEINTDDRTNWEDADVAGGLKPLFFANVDSQKIMIRELCLDHTRTNESVEPTIEKLRSWMRPSERESSPPPLQVLTAGWKQKCVLTDLSVKRSFWTGNGICIRAYFTFTFAELPGNSLQIDATNTRRSRNSLSGRTTQ